MKRRYAWYAPGDINAFFGLMLDNIGVLVLTVTVLSQTFGFPASFAIRYMVPGTALGVLVGDLAFTYMAFQLARRRGRNDVTAMPLGLDTPSTFGMALFVLGPAFREARNAGLDEHSAARLAWHIGIWSILWSGLFKLACAPLSGWVRRLVPRAGLLGSLAAIALVLISFIPLLDIWHEPLTGLTALAVILCTLVARVEFPGRLPGALAALLIGGAIHYVLVAIGWTHSASTSFETSEALWPNGWTDALGFEWWSAAEASLKYVPIVLPFALATVVGGIDCTESAAAVGDEYRTSAVIGVEAVATLLAALCGGVVQTTPYIGHPAYKAMGGRAAYTLATAFFVGGAGLIGYFGYLFAWIPQAAIYPILVFVGLEITAQSFHATPERHYPAVAFACLPALAYLVGTFSDGLLAQSGKQLHELSPPLGDQLQTMRVISAGFIVTSLLWASMLAAMIDRKLRVAAAFCVCAAAASFFGVIHSPLPGSPLALPWNLDGLPPVATALTPFRIAGAYALVAAGLLAWDAWLRRFGTTDHAGAAI